MKLGGDGHAWTTVQADIARCEDRTRVVEETVRGFGRIDAIVNNAALGTCKAIGDLDDSEIHSLFAVNAIGPSLLVREALKELIQSDGCVVNVGSVAMIDPFVGLGIYGSTKAAIDGLTRAIHSEYNQMGIRAYTVAPGAVETDMLRSIVSSDQLPTDLTLSPEFVAAKIIACITGEAPEPSGSTIILNSP